MEQNIEIKRFQDLNLDEKIEVLNWRNSKIVREFMFNKKIISLEEHLNFINHLDNSKIYLKIGDLGVVNFKLFPFYVEFGIHKNPSYKKVGSILLNIGLKEAFKYRKIVILYVFENNLKAIHLYKKFGFNIVDKHKNLLKMELNYENWENRYF